MTEASRQALEVLRDTGQFQWHVVPLFVIVVYIYAVEIERRDWSIILAGLAFWGMDIFNEIWNGLIFHFTQYSAFWTVSKGSAFVMLIGLNIEISLMFAILGIVCIKMLPRDKEAKIRGIPNRWLFVVFNALLCVFIEVLLNLAGALIWEYWFWNIPFVLLIILIGYMPFLIVSFWVYDMEKISNKLKVLAVIFGVDIAAILIFGCGLKWI